MPLGLRKLLECGAKHRRGRKFWERCSGQSRQVSWRGLALGLCLAPLDSAFSPAFSLMFVFGAPYSETLAVQSTKEIGVGILSAFLHHRVSGTEALGPE